MIGNITASIASDMTPGQRATELSFDNQQTVISVNSLSTWNGGLSLAPPTSSFDDLLGITPSSFLIQNATSVRSNQMLSVSCYS